MKPNKKVKGVKGWISKGDLRIAIKNAGKPSERDLSEDYTYLWFAEDSVEDKRGMIEVLISPTTIKKGNKK